MGRVDDVLPDEVGSAGAQSLRGALDVGEYSYEHVFLHVQGPRVEGEAPRPHVKRRRREEPRHEVANGKGGDLHHDLRQFHSFPSSVSAENAAFVNTRVDWKENLEAHVFKADIPGLKKEHVKVEIEDGNILQLSGERNVEKEDKNDKWHGVEHSSGKFFRKFRLSENAKVDQDKDSMENGVLTVTIPKVEIKGT
ncbi:hypothetical protein Fmac_025680 [Flemingia macrophylla]|uniref:SHSP domain-containing protein n=1 Tax=Flemingia macrophylla TaxID=520843 RepID=A0ABD1LSW5_9FABA